MERFDSLIYLGNPLTEWIIALAYIVGSVFVARLVYRIFTKIFKKFTASTESELDDLIVDSIQEPISLAFILLGFYLGYSHLTFTLSGEVIYQIFSVAAVLDITWLAARLLDAAISNLVKRISKGSDGAMINQIAPVLKKVVKAGVWILGMITAMNNVGFQVGPILAGAGIGGLAMAMAAKDFVANIFGGITVFVDKPFTVGDRIKVSGIDGTVLEIGIRSTRIITLEGRTVTIPNHQFTDSVVENVTAEPSRKVKIALGLTYDTPPEKVQLAVNILRDIVGENPDTENDFTVWFSSFGDFSLNVSCTYYIKKTGHWANTPGEINMSILEKFNAEKLDFAFPTQTIITESANP
ncbi:MAG TPA: mechanosensitive ion channel family protein [Flavobacteriales bacterium]|nr:mechanosensitive ion channel family protein [Flavobacteriales bacterium]